MEYKTFQPELKFADQDNPDDPGTVEGYASTFGNFDDVGERVVKGAFSSHLTEFLSSGFVAWNHDWLATPIATPLDAYEDDHGLFVRAQFHTTPEAQNIRKIIRERFDRGKSVTSSIGYQVLDDEQTKEGRLLKDVKLFEWSLVNKPANRQATMFSAKGQPPAGLSLSDHSETVLAAAQELVERYEGLSALRAKSGRVLSAANVTRLVSVKDSLTGLVTELEALLAAAEPEKHKSRQQLRAESLRLRARILGVIT